MPHILITHTCGHQAAHELPRDEPVRREREALLQSRPCGTCWQEQRARSRDARNEAWHLSALEGSPDDIAWAESIRAKALERNREYHGQLLAEEPFAENPALHDLVLATADAALEALREKTNAQWWVQNHFAALDYVKAQIIAALQPQEP